MFLDNLRQCRILLARHTVIETSSYLADARAAGLTEADRDAVVEMIASNPEAGTKSAALVARARFVLAVAVKERAGGIA